LFPVQNTGNLRRYSSGSARCDGQVQVPETEAVRSALHDVRSWLLLLHAVRSEQFGIRSVVDDHSETRRRRLH
jgi:hypothetical protein